MERIHRLAQISAFAVVGGTLLLGGSQPAHARSALSTLIDQCSHGNMAACARGNQVAIAQSQRRAARNMPPAGNGMYVYCAAPSICGARGANALPGNWGWTHGLFADIKRNYPQVWCNLYRNAC
ncbi:MAG TPA: hypothetical protein VJ779_21945 [Acetobacteraceae bacterium]|nr:hypothetical protein [Acetobacteraceae bacterium]